jgi:hypothetical protein
MSSKEAQLGDAVEGSPGETSASAVGGPPPPDVAQTIVDDGDSALGDDATSSTASLSSSILKYRSIHGRTYHSEIGNAQYW